MDESVFYYKVMPFGVKNIGANYKRIMNKVLKIRYGEIYKCM